MASNLSEIRKKLALARKENNELEKELLIAKLENKMGCLTDIIYKNQNICNAIVSLPADEVKLVLNEVVNSDVFGQLFNAALSCEKLSDLRKAKSEKAEKCKASKAEKNQPNNVAAEQSAMSVQAEESEDFSTPVCAVGRNYN